MKQGATLKNYLIQLKTRSRVELLNITNHVEAHLKDADVTSGLVLLYSPHTTSALIINENEERLKIDIVKMLEGLVPSNASYRHDEIDDNADAHLRSILLQPFLIIPVRDKRLQLGTWQSVFFVELDGPREREVVMLIVGI